MRWLDEGPEANDAHIEELLNETGEAAAKRAWQATQNREERQRSSVYTTAEMIVGAFADPRVAEETKGADYSPGRPARRRRQHPLPLRAAARAGAAADGLLDAGAGAARGRL